MPAVSEAQRRLMAIAEHHPDQVSDKNKGVLKMNHPQLHDFAATPGLTVPKKPTPTSPANQLEKYL